MGQLRSRLHLARYAAFALAAIGINLACQNALLMALGGVWYGLYAAIAVATLASLVFKYACDKYWVFGDLDSSAATNSRKFALYSAFGLLTTVIFWATELAFHYAFGTAFMTNLGGFLGLCAGYVIKYNLDKRITFAAPKPAAD